MVTGDDIIDWLMNHSYGTMFRYKCVECGDFVNLCGSCHDQGRHSEYSMVKIVSPFAVCSNGCGVDPILGDR